MSTTDETTNEFKNDAERLAYLGTDTVRWAEALVERFDIQTDDIGEVYGWTANMIMAGYDEASRKGTPIPDPDPTGEYPDGWRGGN